MEIRRPLEWHCKQMDHFVGLNFSANFNFALVGHLLKGNGNSIDRWLSLGPGSEGQSGLLGFRLQATDTRPPPLWPEPSGSCTRCCL